MAENNSEEKNMTYKQNDVFLNAEDCAKIAPYIPKGMLEGWEWWYSQSGKLCFLEWFGANNGYIDGTRGRLHHVNSSYFEKFPKQYQVPALDTGILGTLFLCLKPASKRLWLEGDGSACVGGDFCEGYRRYKRGTELQNRRDALMYLIDNELISPVEGREE